MDESKIAYIMDKLRREPVVENIPDEYRAQYMNFAYAVLVIAQRNGEIRTGANWLLETAKGLNAKSS
jgi:hypothetical protein